MSLLLALTAGGGGNVYTLNCEAGNYVISGQSADLVYIPATFAYSLTCDAGNYVLTGQEATLMVVRASVELWGGGKYRPYILSPVEWQAPIPKKVTKAIEQVAQLKLPKQSAEIALRLRIAEWDNQYLKIQNALQLAVNNALANNLEHLRQIQLREDYLSRLIFIEQRKQQDELAIQLILMLAE